MCLRTVALKTKKAELQFLVSVDTTPDLQADTKILGLSDLYKQRYGARPFVADTDPDHLSHIRICSSYCMYTDRISFRGYRT